MTTALPGARVGALERPARVRAAGAAAVTLGSALVLGAVGWLSVAAAERPSTLSPPTIRHAPGAWMLGPLSGLMPGLPVHRLTLATDLLLAIVVCAVGWLVVWVAAPAARAGWLLLVSALAQALVVIGPPLPLTDVFNYELYGRMAVVHGLNPYISVPAAAAQDPVYGLSNWHHLASPYGPLFTALSELLGPLGVHGWLWAWKAFVLAAGVGAVWLVGALAARLGASRERAIAAFGLCPLFLIHEVGGLHNDLLPMLALLGAAWCVVRSHEPGGAPTWVDPAAGALVIAAAGLKPSFAIVAGIVVLGAEHRWRAAAGAAGAAAVVALLVVAHYGGALPDLASQGALVTPLSLPNLLGLAAGHGGADPAVRAFARDLMLLTALAATVAVALRRDRAIAALGVVLLVAVLTLPWVMPWYLLWALPFIALGRPRWAVPAVAITTAWLVIGGIPQLPVVLHAFGYYPTRTATGWANHLEFVRLLK